MADETFDAAWLQLREPVDHRSRSERLVQRLRVRWEERGWSRILDLGAGTGSNLRYLAPRLPGPQRWVLVERDVRLLGRVSVDADLPGVDSVECVAADLSREGLERVGDTDLVTASALLDLVSEPWLRHLVRVCAEAGAGALFTLTYDGTIAWTGVESTDGPARTLRRPGRHDEWIRRAVNLHQRGDKGFGPALGPAAGEVAEAMFDRAGYDTWRAPSPWRLGEEDGPLALSLVDGWEEATLELAPGEEEGVRSWAKRKRDAIRKGSTRPTVGHVDLLALPR